MELLEIGIVQMAKKESCWLKPAKNGNFIRKINPKMLELKSIQLVEMKQNLGFGINSIWYSS